MDYNDDDYQTNEEKPKVRPPAIRSLLGPRMIPKVVQRRDRVTGEWRNVVQIAKQRMTDEQKGEFLVRYSEWGRLAESAAYAGVSPGTIKKELAEDTDFSDAFLLAEAAYKDRLISHHQNLLFNGTQKDSYDRNGNLVSSETIYPIRLIELELKKHDKGYRDKQEVEVNHTGGVLVVPGEVGSVEDWSKRFGVQDSPGLIEGIAVDITDSSSSSSSED